MAAASLMPAADTFTGFPFQNETLKYNVKWPGGLTRGEVTLSAQQTGGGWTFHMSTNVDVPIVPIADRYQSSAVGMDLCSTKLERAISRGKKKVNEQTEFDQKAGTAERRTLVAATADKPAGGGRSEMQFVGCGRDALTFQYLTRREMGQGRMPAAGKVFFGSGYDVAAVYTGAMEIPIGGKQTTTDHVNVSVKGPASDFTIEIFYARDPARTPLLIKIPVAIGTVSLELVR
jgi:hypothetical protein